MKRKKIFIDGYYGRENLGDDIFLLVLLKNLSLVFPKHDIIVYVNDKNKLPLEVKDLLDSELNNYNIYIYSKNLITRIFQTINAYLSDVVILGGGTFIYEDHPDQRKNLLFLCIYSQIAKIFNKKIFAIGIGCDKVESKLIKFLSKRIFKSMHKIVVRDQVSLKNSKRIYQHQNIITLPDIAYLYSKILSSKKTKCDHIGINLASHSSASDFQAAKSVISKLLELDYQLSIIIVQNNQLSQEWSITRDLLSDFDGLNIIRYENNINLFRQEISACSFIIGSKLHLLISAHMLDIPSIALAYQEKVQSITNHFMNSEYQLSLADSPKSIVNKLEKFKKSGNYAYRETGSQFAKILSKNFPLIFNE